MIYRKGKEIHVMISKRQYTNKLNLSANGKPSKYQINSPTRHDQQEDQTKAPEIPSK
jgi:hypothetical protein